MGAYRKLARRINRFPQGAPPSDLLYRILGMLFDRREAELVSRLPLRPFGAARAAKVWKMKPAAARGILDRLAGRGLLIDILLKNGNRAYVLPPPMAGFFEFSLMRVRHDIDQAALSDLFYRYINQEPEFVQALFLTGHTGMGRAFIHEPALPDGCGSEILDYEKASHVIRTADPIAVGLCYCRRKMAYVGRGCTAPLDICMIFNTAAAAVIRNGLARRVEVAECLDLLQQAYEANLVQGGDNVREQVSFICNCCSCCCEGLIAARRFGRQHPVKTTNLVPRVDASACSGCGKCAAVCPVAAISLIAVQDPRRPERKRAEPDEEVCLGCGLCSRNCPSGAIRLEARAQRIVTPADSVHRVVLMAIERGRLQDLIFDNQALISHRLLAAILGAILKLPPVKQALASRQLRSRYIENIIQKAAAAFGKEESWLNAVCRGA